MITIQGFSENTTLQITDEQMKRIKDFAYLIDKPWPSDDDKATFDHQLRLWSLIIQWGGNCIYRASRRYVEAHADASEAFKEQLQVLKDTKSGEVSDEHFAQALKTYEKKLDDLLYNSLYAFIDNNAYAVPRGRVN